MADGILTELNLIDIFGYMIPGSLLLAGVLIPLTFQFALPESEIAGLTIAAVFAFTLGLATGSVRHRIRRLFARFVDWEGVPGASSRAEFRADMWLAREYARYDTAHGEERDTDFHAHLVETYPDVYAGTDDIADRFRDYLAHRYFDYEVWRMCEDTFNLQDEFEDINTLFNLVLTHLETTPYTRAFRMQALYTLSSQILVTSAMLAVYYAVLLILALGGVGKEYIGEQWILFALVTVAIVFIIVFRNLTETFDSLWNRYTKLEFYLDRTLESR